MPGNGIFVQGAGANAFYSGLGGNNGAAQFGQLGSTATMQILGSTLTSSDGAVTPNTTVLGPTGVTQTNSFGNTASVTNNVNGSTYSGFVAAVGYTPQQIALSSQSITGANSGGTQTFSINSSDGSASFGNTSVGGTLGVTGLTTLSGGLGVTGGTTTDTLNVTGATTTNGINNNGGGITNAGAVSGVTTLNASGNITTTGEVFAHSLDIGSSNTQFTVASNGNTTINGTLAANGTATIGGGTATSFPTNSVTTAASGQTAFNAYAPTASLNVSNGAAITGGLGVTGNAYIQGTGVNGTHALVVSNNGNNANPAATLYVIGSTDGTGSANFANNSGANPFRVDGTTGNVLIGGTFNPGSFPTANNNSTQLNTNGAASTFGNATNGVGGTNTVTSIQGGFVQLSNPGAGAANPGTITLDARTDPTFTVSNGGTGAALSQTVVHNGFVTVTGGNTANTGTGFGNAAVNISGGAQVNSGGLVVTGPVAPVAPSYGTQTVSFGGNEVQGVGTPILGTDAANKAYVDTTVNKAKNQAFEGTAVALAISQPIFLPGQSFAVRAGWGDYQSQNAFGVSAAGVVGHDVFGYGSTVTVDAGVGVGTNYNSVGGKVGVTLGFGGGNYPLK